MSCKRHPEPVGFKYRQQYGVIVICEDEGHQKRVFKELSAMGLKLKVVCV